MIEIHHVHDDGLRGAYDSLYDERPIRHSDSLYKWLLTLLKPRTGTRLLDIACGQGRLAELASDYGVQGIGFDLSFEALSVSTLKGQAVLVCNGEALSFPDRSFDYITNIGSLEHYVNPTLGAQEMARVLRPGGLACILLPNMFGIFNTVLYNLHTGKLADDGQPIQRYGTRDAWQKLLKEAGFKIIKTYKYEAEWPIYWKDWGNYLRHPKALVRMLLTPILPVNISNSFVFICTTL